MLIVIDDNYNIKNEIELTNAFQLMGCSNSIDEEQFRERYQNCNQNPTLINEL